MAEAVELALEREHHLFVEAGTGTGKTLAYLVPAVLSGRKVVISTATRALQEQIFVKDLPIVAEALAVHGVTLRASLMKGLSNYVCRRRLGEARASGDRGLALARIADWAQTTETGDRAELTDLPEDAEAWRDVASSSETRIGAGCEHFEECFVTRMRREAEDAQIVVVNHHLLLADLALRTGRRGAHASVLPPYDAIVFDEAHQVEDVATDFFGVRVSSARVDAFVRDAEHALAAANALEALKSGPVRQTLESAREAGRALFACLLRETSAGSADARRMLLESDVTSAVRDAHDALDLRLEALEGISRSRGNEEALLLIARRATELRDDLRSILAGTWVTDDGEVSGVVRWIDVRSRSVSLGMSPVDVGATLRTRLFDRVPTVVCTSATLGDRDELPLRQVAARGPAGGRGARPAVPFRFRLAGGALPSGRPARARRPSLRGRRDRPHRRARGDDGRRRIRALHVGAGDAGPLLPPPGPPAVPSDGAGRASEAPPSVPLPVERQGGSRGDDELLGGRRRARMGSASRRARQDPVCSPQ